MITFCRSKLKTYDKTKDASLNCSNDLKKKKINRLSYFTSSLIFKIISLFRIDGYCKKLPMSGIICILTRISRVIFLFY